jgi:murein lipoprotein
MSPTRQHLGLVRTLGVALVATVGLSACATYTDEFAAVNSRLDQIDARVQGAAQSADRANQRLDQLEGRVQRIEAAPARRPRG